MQKRFKKFFVLSVCMLTLFTHAKPETKFPTKFALSLGGTLLAGGVTLYLNGKRAEYASKLDGPEAIASLEKSGVNIESIRSTERKYTIGTVIGGAATLGLAGLTFKFGYDLATPKPKKKKKKKINSLTALLDGKYTVDQTLDQRGRLTVKDLGGEVLFKAAPQKLAFVQGLLSSMPKKNPEEMREEIGEAIEGAFNKYLPGTLQWFIDKIPNDGSIQSKDDFVRWSIQQGRNITPMDIAQEACDLDELYTPVAEDANPEYYLSKDEIDRLVAVFEQTSAASLTNQLENLRVQLSTLKQKRKTGLQQNQGYTNLAAHYISSEIKKKNTKFGIILMALKKFYPTDE